MKRVTTHLREDQIKELENRKKEHGIKKSDLIRRALDEYFENHYREGQDVLI